MTPTTKLRIVKRKVIHTIDPMGNKTSVTSKVLQQWWGFEEDETVGEWRDVPVEGEQA